MKNRDELQLIHEIISSSPAGIGIEQLLILLPFRIEKRALQRRLKALKENGVIRTEGEARATKYYLNSPDTPENTNNNKFKNEHQSLIPLSQEGKEIFALVSRPEAQRKPVGYERDFLENYRPNFDSFLSKEEKQKLAEWGNTRNGEQPAGTYAREILNRLLIDLSWNSSRLEGNTYSLLDTELLIHNGKTPANKSPMETQMILNHKEAIEFLVESSNEVGFNRYTFLNLHALLSNNLLPNPAASGRLRTFGIGITNSVFTPLGIPQLIEESFNLILAKASQIQNPFEQAFFVLVQLPYLQPFDDVNKRVSRLAANIPLNKHNLAPLSFIDVPEESYVKGLLGIYELNRIELFKDVFLWAYERSALRYAAIRQSLGEPDPFRMKYREEIRAIVSHIVSNAMDKEAASQAIKSEVKKLPEPDQSRFSEVVETELLGLHEGNFVRYRIRPSEFSAWKMKWDAKE
ncbi:Fic/DOC family protein [Algoriphagus aquaeductus]|uniref:Fic/DOC family protein n=1 Tax=Algoriphagus aquaeductus TaxID=475299 RepID=A0A326RUD1_9BACT|nr:Fic family protein [Algoriphagus aquaeductus]PZV75471.1 Fic/DOC family protein [Algoriphagus aquaeductus]